MPDKLLHTKQFLVSIALDGFGVRKFTSDFIPLGPGRKRVEKACGQLYAAVKEDDPDFVYPSENPSEAMSNAAVKLFVERLEFEKEIIQDSDQVGGPTDEMMFTPGPYGCFLDSLIDAVRLDDPTWREEV